MKNLKKLDCINLTSAETQQINGGTDQLKIVTWYDFSYTVGAALNGFFAFSTEGGRNAGISVR